MDAAQALSDLTEISSQIQAAVLFDADGSVQGSTLGDAASAERLARSAAALLDRAAALRGDDSEVAQVEASTAEGCVFVVRDGDRRIAATTVPQPTVGLVFYDLKSCLRDSEPEKPKRRAPKKKDEE